MSAVEYQNLTLPRLIIAGVLFVTGLMLYLATLAPSVVTLFDDSLEFQLVTYQLGIAHPTGYPLYTLLGKLFTFLPVGDVAYRVNLMSAFFGAATVALLYLLIVQIATPVKEAQAEAWTPGWSVHLGGISGALLFAVGPVFWQQATLAEVYTLNAFFVIIILLVAATLPSLEGGFWRGVLWLACLFGLGLTHHRTLVWVAPALGLYLYLNQNPGCWKQPGFYRTLLLSILLGLAPLLLYLYLPLRGHIGSLDGTYENTWAGFWRQVSAGGYGVFIFGNPFDQERDFSFYWNLFQSQFYTVIPGFIGLFYLLWRGQRRLLFLTGTAFLTYVTFNLFYKVGDIDVFFIPPFLIWAAWSGVGVGFVLKVTADPFDRLRTGRRPPTAGQPSTRFMNVQRLKPIATILLLAIFAFIIFHIFQTGLPTLQARNTWQVHDYGLDMLQQPLPKRAAMVGILGEITLLRYFQQTENRRPEVETVAADLEADRLAAVEKLLAEGKTVYLTREAAMLPGTKTRWSLNAVGPLTRIDPEPVTRPPQFMFAVNQPVIPAITLLGYDLSRPPHTGKGLAPLRLTLFWQVTAPITRNLKVSTRLLNPVSEVVVAADAVPVHFAYPTTAWRPGEVVSDVYDLALPADLSAGSYTPLIIWYDPAQNSAEVGRIELRPAAIG